MQRLKIKPFKKAILTSRVNQNFAAYFFAPVYRVLVPSSAMERKVAVSGWGYIGLPKNRSGRPDQTVKIRAASRRSVVPAVVSCASSLISCKTTLNPRSFFSKTKRKKELTTFRRKMSQKYA